MGQLLFQYTKRYEKIHKSASVYKWLFNNLPLNFPQNTRTPFPICMKDEYKISEDVVECYKNYYIKDKVRFAKWEPRATTPKWYKEMLNA